MTPTQVADFHDAYQHFAGFDWAKDEHDVVLVDRHGQVLEQFQFDDSAQGWSTLR